MSNELDRLSQSRYSPALRATRSVRAETKKVMEQTVLTGLKLEANAALWSRGMQLLSDVDSERQALARNNPEAAALLAQFEMGYAVDAQAIIRRGSSPFGF